MPKLRAPEPIRHPCLDSVQEKYDICENVMQEFSRTGAADTEPDVVLQRIILEAARGGDVHVGADPQFWDLFHANPDSYKAAEALQAAAESLIAAIGAMQVRDLPKLRQWVEWSCWRCF